MSLFLIVVKKQSQKLTRVNPDRNIFSINVELTSTFLLYKGLVHHHHRILNENCFQLAIQSFLNGGLYIFKNYPPPLREEVNVC